MRLIFPGIKIKQNFKIPQLCSSIAHIQPPLQSARKDKYNFCSLYLCGRITDFQRKGCYLGLTLTTTISSFQTQVQGPEGRMQPVPRVKTQHGHGLEHAPQKTSCRDIIHASKGEVGTTLRLVYFIKLCLNVRSEIIHGETKSFPFISPPSHCLLQPVPADLWQLHVPASPFLLLPSTTKPSAGVAVGAVAERAELGRRWARGIPVPLRQHHVSPRHGPSCPGCNWAEGTQQKGPSVNKQRPTASI